MNVKELLEQGADRERLLQLFQMERYAWMALSYDMAVAIDIDGCILSINAAWQRATGFWPEALRGKYLIEFIHFDDRERVLGCLQSLITSDTATTTFEFRFRCRDEVYKRFNWNVLYSPDNELFYCIVKDLSEVNDLRHAAYHDTLTGLPNRLFLTDALPRLIDSAKRHKHHLALYFIDLDGFKEINDTQGHLAGDILLQTVAERVSQCASRSDNCARLGGDEFVLFELWPCTCRQAGELAERLLTEVNQPIPVNGRKVSVGASIGIAMAPEQGSDPVRLLELADKAMYRAKHAGRNNFRFADASDAGTSDAGGPEPSAPQCRGGDPS